MSAFSNLSSILSITNCFNSALFILLPFTLESCRFVKASAIEALVFCSFLLLPFPSSSKAFKSKVCSSSEASLIKEIEKRELGTKATRADIISTLYDRNYVTNKSIEVTNLGMKTIETLKKYCSDIIDQDLTREFGKELEQIREGKSNPSSS